MPIERIAAGLDDALRLLSQGSRTTLAHHQTLHASIAWSVDLLDDIETTVLSSLTVFRSPFLLDGAVEVATDGGNVEALSVIRALGRLVDKSLLQFDAAIGRYRMLETIRQFCDQRAHGTPELDRARARHTHYRARVVHRRRGGSLRRGTRAVRAGDARRDRGHEVGSGKTRRSKPCASARVSGPSGRRSVTTSTWQRRGIGSWRSIAMVSSPASGRRRSPHACRPRPVSVSTSRPSVPRRPVVSRSRTDGRLAGSLAATRWCRHIAGTSRRSSNTAESIVADREDLEISIYVGFAAYMLSVAGRLDEATHWIGEQRRMTRRQHTTFSVDSVGNGYAAAILVAAAGGDLTAAANHASVAVPTDPAFSMTAADALAQVALMTDDLGTLRSAIEWSRRGTIPLLRSLATWIECARATFNGDVEARRDAAERYWEEARPIPLNRVHRRAFLNIPLLETRPLGGGRGRECRGGGRGCRDGLRAALRRSPPTELAQLALCRGDLSLLLETAGAMLEIVLRHRFVPMTIDALELVAVGTAQVGSPDAACILDGTLAERDRIGYRLVMIAPRKEYLDLLRGDAPLPQAAEPRRRGQSRPTTHRLTSLPAAEMREGHRVWHSVELLGLPPRRAPLSGREQHSRRSPRRCTVRVLTRKV